MWAGAAKRLMRRGSAACPASSSIGFVACFEVPCECEGVEEKPQPKVRFMWIDIFVDAKDQPLAASQFELAAKADAVKIVGIEGGEHPAFREPPYYDPAALQNERVIIAAFNTGDNLPHRRCRVARLMVQVTGEGGPDYAVWLRAAASSDGKRIPATITTEQGEAK
jgi:hypothetical protein